MTAIKFRRAVEGDLDSIVRMLTDDPRGSTRERYEQPLPEAYHRAFAAIDQDPNNELVVVIVDDQVGGVMQLTFIPNLTYTGGWRAQIEGVRIDKTVRKRGIGRQMMEWALNRARERDCCLVQLTTDNTRHDSHRFYESLGFVDSHKGMKLHL